MASRTVELSDRTATLRVRQRGVVLLQTELLALRATLADLGLNPEEAAKLNPLDPALDPHHAVALSSQLAHLSTAYALAFVESWTADEPVTEDALLDLDVMDYNTLVRESIDLFKEVFGQRDPLGPLPTSETNSANSDVSSLGLDLR